jgi:hypothetical protein
VTKSILLGHAKSVEPSYQLIRAHELRFTAEPS